MKKFTAKSEAFNKYRISSQPFSKPSSQNLSKTLKSAGKRNPTGRQTK